MRGGDEKTRLYTISVYYTINHYWSGMQGGTKEVRDKYPIN
jgi:hypothetical protein